MVSFQPAWSASRSARVTDRVSGRHSPGYIATRTATALSPAVPGTSTIYLHCVYILHARVWSGCEQVSNVKQLSRSVLHASVVTVLCSNVQSTTVHGQHLLIVGLTHAAAGIYNSSS